MKRKITVFTCLVLLLVSACGGKQVQKGSYVYHHESNELYDGYLYLSDNDEFDLYPAMISSTVAKGSYKVEGNKLVLTDEISNVNLYFIIEDGNLTFEAQESHSLPYLQDGAVFSFEE